MLNSLLADLVLLLHLLFIVFAMLGALLVLRWRWAALLHLPMLAWGVAIELTGGICPLTPLENTLRRAAGEGGYSGSFLEHYLLPIVYPAGLTSDVQLGLGVGLLLLNVVLYGFVLLRLRRRRASLDGRESP
jgi:hypothetical protein